MKCPDCSGSMKVTSTVFPYRYRKCDFCGRRIKTIEIFEKAYKIFLINKL